MTDVFLVTAESHPALFKAFELISHDCGRQAGHLNYAVPLVWQGTIQEIEHDLSTLLAEADSDFEALCTGDEEDRQRIVQGYRITLADQLLHHFFEEFS